MNFVELFKIVSKFTPAAIVITSILVIEIFSNKLQAQAAQASLPVTLSTPKLTCVTDTIKPDKTNTACLQEGTYAYGLFSSTITATCEKLVREKASCKELIPVSLMIDGEVKTISLQRWDINIFNQAQTSKTACPIGTQLDSYFKDYCVGIRAIDNKKAIFGPIEKDVIKACLDETQGKTDCFSNSYEYDFYRKLAQKLALNFPKIARAVPKMNIVEYKKKENDVRAFGLTRSRVNKPEQIIIHHTGVPRSNTQVALNTISSSMSVQYLVADNGTIYYFFDANHHPEGTRPFATIFELDPEKMITTNTPKTQIIDETSIQIEINYDPWKSAQAPSSKAMKETAKLIADIAIRYNIEPTALFGHSSVQPCGSKVTKSLCRHNEPSFLLYNSTNDRQVKIHSNWFSFVSEIRANGAFKQGKWAKMSDRELALIIAKVNLSNAHSMLEVWGNDGVIVHYKNALKWVNAELKTLNSQYAQ